MPLLEEHLKTEYRGAESKNSVVKAKMELLHKIALSTEAVSRPFLYLRYWKL